MAKYVLPEREFLGIFGPFKKDVLEHLWANKDKYYVEEEELGYDITVLVEEIVFWQTRYNRLVDELQEKTGIKVSSKVRIDREKIRENARLIIEEE